jgi:hypothetical protein
MAAGAGPLIGDDKPSAVTLAGLTVLAADGMLVNLADTPANRAMFGSTGTAGDSAPFPQLRVVALTVRAGRALLGAILGCGAAGGQTLLKRLARRRPDLFAGRVTCFDRNFPGYELITAILGAGGHVTARGAWPGPFRVVPRSDASARHQGRCTAGTRAAVRGRAGGFRTLLSQWSRGAGLQRERAQCGSGV